jgi:hypothetical protein
VAGELTGQGRSASARSVQGLGFAAGIYLAYDCMSTLNSSPWTHETFGGSPGKAASAQRYVRLAIIRSTALAALTAWIMGDISPLLGASVANADLFYVYRKAGSIATEGGH